MSVITGLFNVLALVYIFRGLQLAVNTGRNWKAVTADPLTRAKQQQAEQAAFFISVPPSVFVHELFHALAIWLFGGRVVEFGYRVFWGYVVPEGQFTPAQDWVIGLAGTVGSLLFGLLVWLALRNNRSQTLRYFGLRSLRYQLYFSLIYYPVFSLFLPIGDWRTIYDFRTTPVLSAGMAAVHAFLLAWFWYAERHGWFEMPAYSSAAAQKQYEATEAAAARGDEQAQLQLAGMMLAGGAPHQMKQQLEAVRRSNPDSIVALLLQAEMENRRGAGTSRKTAAALERALQQEQNPTNAAAARQRLAEFALERGDGAAAEAQINQALAPANPEEGAAYLLPPLLLADLLFTRGRARRRLDRLDAAAADVGQAIELAQTIGERAAAARYAEELAVIEARAAKLGGPASTPPGVSAR